MKIQKVEINLRKKALVLMARGRALEFPFAKLTPLPTRKNPLIRAWVDEELGMEGVSYLLQDGREGVIHLDHVLEYHQDPKILWELFMHQLQVKVREQLDESTISKREIARRLETSPAQFYRLMDEKAPPKSLHQIFAILQTLNCKVNLVIRKGKRQEVIEWGSHSPHAP